MVFKSPEWPYPPPPQYMKDLFQYVGEVSCRSTHNSDKTKLYVAPGSHLKVDSDIFQFSAAAARNKLQIHPSTHLPTYLPTYLPNLPTYQPTYPCTHLLTYLPTYL